MENSYVESILLGLFLEIGFLTSHLDPAFAVETFKVILISTMVFFDILG